MDEQDEHDADDGADVAEPEATGEVREPRVEAWTSRTEWLMVALAVAFLVAFAWPILNPDLGVGMETWLLRVTQAVWLLFAIEFGIRLVLARRRGRYLKKHWYDVLLVVLPALQPLKLLQMLTVFRFFGNTTTGLLAGRVTIYVLGITATAMSLGALGVLRFEREAPGATIQTVGDAFWWSMTTVTTVGYGDLYPVTGPGRFIAALLMLVGVGLVGTVTATVSGWFISRVDQEGRRGAR